MTRLTLVALLAGVSGVQAGSDDLAIRLTSPLGRVGAGGVAVRIVAQVSGDPATRGPVRFFVDGALLGTVDAGPPYAVEWIDENPFEPREISVEVSDAAGRRARDAVRLPPLEIVEEAAVSSVLVEATVLDGEGRFVGGLDPEAFLLAEDGQLQAIELLKEHAAAATYTVLVDCSPSLARQVPFLRGAAEALVRQLRPEDRVVVAPFGARLGTVTGPTKDRATIAESLAALPALGGTGIHDAVVALAERLGPSGDRRAVLLLTDGYDESSRHSVEEAIEAAHAAGLTLYPVGIGGVAGLPLRSRDLLTALAEGTGGRPVIPRTEQELPVAYERIVEEIARRYLIAYTPENQEPDGAWRRIEVRVPDPTHTVRARPGYRAPSPPPLRPSIEFGATTPDGGYPELSADDLVVLEDGVEQRIDSFQEAVMPVSLVLALDASGSMRGGAEAAVAAAAAFVEALPARDRLGLVTFSDRALFAHDLTSNRESTRAALAEYVPRGGTALYDALWEALGRLRRETGRRAIVVVTDGKDENGPGTAPGSVRRLEEVEALARDTGAIIYAIGVGDSIDRPTLERLAALSGGVAYFPHAPGELNGEFERVVENLRRRYLLAYESTNPTRDGAWRAVEIRGRTEPLVIASPGGYRAPGDPAGEPGPRSGGQAVRPGSGG